MVARATDVNFHTGQTTEIFRQAEFNRRCGNKFADRPV